MVSFAVSISSFLDSRFRVINSVWESEGFVGFLNFTLMADIHFKGPRNLHPRG
jgi:hypothetical protein